MDDIFTADYSEGLLELLEWRWARRGSRTAGRTRPAPRQYLEIEKKFSLRYGSAFFLREYQNLYFKNFRSVPVNFEIFSNPGKVLIIKNIIILK